MFCLKCGKETEEKAVFCQHCLSEMEKYPVKPDVKFFLPKATAPAVAKKAPSRRKVLTSEERISRMKKAIQWLCILLSVAVLSLALSVALLMDSFSSEDPQTAIGQNYGTIEENE